MHIVWKKESIIYEINLTVSSLFPTRGSPLILHVIIGVGVPFATHRKVAFFPIGWFIVPGSSENVGTAAYKTTNNTNQ